MPLLHPEIFKAAKPDGLLLIDDGKVRLRIVAHDEDTIDAEVEVAGTISDRKGVNLPNLVLPMSPMTPKDRKDLDFGLSLGVDWVALSFVQHAHDIAELKKLVAGRAAVMAKLEKPAAIEHLDEIIEQSDGIMVARGDLGVEMPPEAVPPLQKRILAACRVAGKPAIVATQMLDSMVHSPTPTRAEASDVATAVYDGTDAVMLSAESASGDYPIEAVTIMDRIIKSVEGDPLYRRLMDASRHEPEATTADAISAAARQCAHTLSAAAIVTYTNTGSTTLRAARERPDVRILCLTPNLDTARRMTLDLGRPSGSDRRRAQFRRHGAARRPRRPPGGAGQGRRAARDHRRRAVRHARRDQHPADRLRLTRLGDGRRPAAVSTREAIHERCHAPPRFCLNRRPARHRLYRDLCRRRARAVRRSRPGRAAAPRATL